MNERTIFTEALERETATERSAYLDAACAGDEAIRGRVEALLRSHDQAGTFLGKPVPERLGEGLAAEKAGDDTQTVPSAPEADDGLDFLEPSDKPGVLGRLGHYEVLEVLGRGGMGVVLRAFDEQLHRVVAIKVMAAQLATNGAARRRFTREARAAAAVSHDHVVTIHAVEDASPRPHIVMQYVAGASLQERLDRTGPLPLPEILRIGMQAAAGLAAAHAQGLVHRDVKPANILLENGVERVKLTDFGLARAADDASLTQSGAVAGTPSFMSPEQAEGRPVEQRSDLFSLGSALYAMCTGRPPFRAGTNIGVLKRVCEETPTPIRETNPEVPDWLAAVVEKLHAKDPAGRFQTAAEVAELLGQYLAHVQHPSAVALPAVVTPAAAPPPSGRAARHHRWAVAAAVLVALFAVLGTTEATGVTNVRATIIRVFTPDGTLVVETDDPDVKVTVEGDGGLVVTGAGLQEIRLKPGSYRVLADRDGKRVPLDRELVTVSSRGREIVRVKLEAPSSLPAATAEKGAFVLLAAGKERKFDTLAEVVLTSADGDTIEIRGNGPFITQPISINNRALVIRAGAGFLPVIKADPDEQGTILLNSNSLLVLEGLDLQWVEAKPFDPSDPRYPFLVTSGGPTARLYAVNCRFLMNRREGPHQMSCIGVHDPALCHLRNCQLLVVGHGAVCPVIDMLGSPNTTVMVDNCLTIGQGMTLIPTRAEPTKVFLNHNTFLGPCFVAFYLKNKIDPPGGEKDARSFSIVSTANIFGGLMTFTQSPDYLAKEMVLSARDTERLLTQLVGWQDNRNLYCSPEGNALLELFAALNPWPPTPVPPTVPITTLLAWKNFWGMEELNSQRGQAKFQGGDLVAKAQSTPELIVPEDFRLRSDSAGYRSGKDGKDLGADVDLVGPGAAYERWKKTPEYQQWLKDTGQLRAEAPKPEPGAFVLLAAGKERKFDTLAEAVLTSADGDTIEVRGNGPFVTEPLLIHHALTIRAGEGFRPAVRISPGMPGDDYLITTHNPLVLEGLDIREESKKRSQPVLVARSVIYSDAKSLHLANCRVWQEEPAHEVVTLIMAHANIILRNCEFRPKTDIVSLGNDVPGRCVIDNCLGLGGGPVFLHYGHASNDVLIEFRRCTFAMLHGAWVGFSVTPDPPRGIAGEKRVRFESSANVFDMRDGILGFLALEPFRERANWQKPGDAEAVFSSIVGWGEKRNVHSPGATSIWWAPGPGVSRRLAPGNLKDWQRRWNLTDTDSIEGSVRFQGGDLLVKATTAPEKLTTADFHLRPDSAGYRAGKDGKDLGADVDLVGPGAAYERWKKTPEYQEWLKETGQVKK